MKKNLLASVISLLVSYSIQASDELAPSSLEMQISQVLKFIEHQKSPKLVLGVPDTEEDIETRLPHYVLLDVCHEDRKSQRSLTVDFNSLQDLEKLSVSFSGRFKSIILDDSTFICTDWSKEHISYFYSLLEVGGKFVFSPRLGSTIPVFTKYSSQEEASKLLAKKCLSHPENKDKIITLIFTPYTLPIIDGAYKEEIDDLVAKHHLIFQEPTKETQRDKARELGLTQFYTQSQIKSEEDLYLKVAERINIKMFDQSFMRDKIVPKSYLPILESVFGKGNVNVEYDKPLPIQSGWVDTQQILITAKRVD